MNKNTNKAVSIHPITWVSLPAYASMYLRPQIESLRGLNQIVDYIHHLYSEEEVTANVERIFCLVTIREELISSLKK